MNCKECGSPFYEDEQVFTGDQGWICKDCSDKRAEERFENADEEELLEYFRGSLNANDMREMMCAVPDVKENFKDGYIHDIGFTLAVDTEEWQGEQVALEENIQESIRVNRYSYKGAS